MIFSYRKNRREKSITMVEKNTSKDEIDLIKNYIESKGFSNISSNDSDNQIYTKNGSSILIKKR